MISVATMKVSGFGHQTKSAIAPKITAHAWKIIHAARHCDLRLSDSNSSSVKTLRAWNMISSNLPWAGAVGKYQGSVRHGFVYNREWQHLQILVMYRATSRRASW